MLTQASTDSWAASASKPALQCVAMSSIADRIREARAKRGWSQNDLAKACGVTKNAVSMWEGGKNNVASDNLVRISYALKVEHEWLVHGNAETVELPSESSRELPSGGEEVALQLILQSVQNLNANHKTLTDAVRSNGAGMDAVADAIKELAAELRAARGASQAPQAKKRRRTG